MPHMPLWKQELIKMHLQYLEKTAPGFFKASGGYSMKVRMYSDTNTNGLTNCVKSFLEYKGHYCIRTNRQGQARIERIPVGGTQKTWDGKGAKTVGKITYTKNPEEKAFCDLHASINGTFVAIEIKCAKTRDKLSKEQLDNKEQVEASGGIHIVVPNMEWFYTWYNNFIKIK